MLPSPLHPAIVHFPIVFMILLPIAALGAMWAIRRGTPPRRAWALPQLIATALVLSAWVSVQTGEADEERAEEVAGEAILHAHEEAAEQFLLLGGGVMVLMAAGFLRSGAGRAGRAAASMAALALTIAGYQAGHSGGRVVYGHGTSPGISTISTHSSDGIRPNPEFEEDSD